jgi:hypothetical protein
MRCLQGLFLVLFGAACVAQAQTPAEVDPLLDNAASAGAQAASFSEA